MLHHLLPTAWQSDESITCVARLVSVVCSDVWVMLA
ncbi:hypothetical protein T11_12232 [Trichinella zimbabwensis]|uniref:Uncharacterized protein n=1 Tax=Trichinella zimbabwensis TaxID=268475 RepID=A0A0V1GGE1_9BILA|nr:hypothetical protein T11_12232 [Trichinella zimbabwensis]